MSLYFRCDICKEKNWIRKDELVQLHDVVSCQNCKSKLMVAAITYRYNETCNDEIEVYPIKE
jgi:DNA-directed RNA polymerase subunit RPC12/RpoP